MKTGKDNRHGCCNCLGRRVTPVEETKEVKEHAMVERNERVACVWVVGGWRGRGGCNVVGACCFSTCRFSLLSLVDFLLLAEKEGFFLFLRAGKKITWQFLMIVRIGSTSVPVLSVQSCRTGCTFGCFICPVVAVLLVRVVGQLARFSKEKF